MTKAERDAFREHCQDMQKACEHDSWEKCAKAMHKAHGKLAECFGKSASEEGGDDSAKVTTAIDSLRSDFEKRMTAFEKTLIPSDVRGAFLTEPPAGSHLVGRAGGPTPPVAADAVDPAFRHLFTE